MARPKNYVDKLTNLENEIDATERKLRTLYEERDELQKEKDMSEIQNIYKMMRDNGVTVEQLFASVQKPKRPYNRKPKTETAEG
jgi:uncharacterized coiled-coil DUF342 family protein